MFTEFNKFNICLTEKLWQLDSENKSEFFPNHDETNTGMHQSAKEGNVEDVQIYLEHLSHDKNPGAKVEGEQKGNTPMHIAAYSGRLNVIQLIKTTTGVANPAAANGITVLHFAAQQGHLGIVQDIVQDLDNRNPAAEGFHNWTPFHHAALNGQLEVIRFLSQIIPDVTIVDSNGLNALHLAAAFGQLEVVKLLADIISIDIKNKFGKTASDYAKLQGHQSVFNYLTNWKINLDRLPDETRQQGARRRSIEQSR